MSFLLDRHTSYNAAPSLSKAQLQSDGIFNHLTHEASDVGNILAMTSAVFAFRGLCLGIQSFGMPRVAASVAALGGEVTVFRSVSNFASRLRGQAPQEDVFNLKGWTTTFVNFASLKLAGVAAQNSNVVFAHALQSTAMVGSHHLAYSFNLTTAPEGSLASQFTYAEASLLALGAGQSLFNLASAGRILRAERSLHLIDQTSAFRPNSSRRGALQKSALSVMANESSEGSKIFRVGSLHSLVSLAQYAGVCSVKTLRANGNFGLGTFEALDGEMIVLNGRVYQVRPNGEALIAEDQTTTPFAIVTSFKASSSLFIGLEEALNSSSLATVLDRHLPAQERAYAIQLEGTFRRMKVRTVLKQAQPYPSFTEATRTQAVFERQNVQGVLVGFRFPLSQAQTRGSGYHFHFLAEDGSVGGHLMEFEMGSRARINTQEVIGEEVY